MHPCLGREGGSNGATEAAPPVSVDGAVWIDLLEPTPEEMARVQASTGLRIPTREALREIESSSRNYMEGGAVYLSTPLIARAFSPEGALTPVGFVFNNKVLITIRYAAFVAFDLVAEQVKTQPDLIAEEALVLLLESVVDKGADLLERIGEELDKVSHSAFHTDQTKGRKKNLSAATEQLRHALRRIGQMGDRTSQIRDSLLGVGRITGYLMETACHDWPQPLKQRMGAVRGDIVSLNDYEAHLSNKVQFLLDATLGFINIEQNDIVKVLTIASIVGVPPVFLAGVWGMNFHNIPEFSLSYGYPLAWAAMILSAVIPLVWFKWRGWM
jgi:magnesium transporter